MSLQVDTIYTYLTILFHNSTQGASDRRRRTPFRIPHSLVFLPDKQEVCVADRENGRIQCFIAETGEFVKEIKKEEFGGKVFAITYSPVGGEFTHWQAKLITSHHLGSTVFFLC